MLQSETATEVSARPGNLTLLLFWNKSFDKTNALRT